LIVDAKKCISDSPANNPNASTGFGDFCENGVDVIWQSVDPFHQVLREGGIVGVAQGRKGKRLLV
jgi:hypothetical protein